MKSFFNAICYKSTFLKYIFNSMEMHPILYFIVNCQYHAKCITYENNWITCHVNVCHVWIYFVNIIVCLVRFFFSFKNKTFYAVLHYQHKQGKNISRTLIWTLISQVMVPFQFLHLQLILFRTQEACAFWNKQDHWFF